MTTNTSKFSKKSEDDDDGEKWYEDVSPHALV